MDGDESCDLFVYPTVEQQLLFDLGVEGEVDADVRLEDAPVCFGELVVEIFASLSEEKVVEDEEAEELVVEIFANLSEEKVEEDEELSIEDDQG